MSDRSDYLQPFENFGFAGEQELPSVEDNFSDDTEDFVGRQSTLRSSVSSRNPPTIIQRLHTNISNWVGLGRNSKREPVTTPEEIETSMMLHTSPSPRRASSIKDSLLYQDTGNINNLQ